MSGLPTTGNGSSSLLVSQPVFWIRPKVVTGVVVPPPGVSTEVNATLTPDYSMMLRQDQQWTVPSPCWYQTFVSTGSALSGVVVTVAGKAPTTSGIHAQLLVQPSTGLGADGGATNVTQWPPVVRGGGKSTTYKLGTNTDMWLRWRSDEVPLSAGTTYALQVCGEGGDIQPYKRNKDAHSYQGGRAFDGSGAAQAFDINAVVFTDNDGTRLTVAKRTPGLGSLVDDYWGKAWAQSFTASDTGGLAGADVFLAGAAGEWNLTLRWSVHAEGSDGPGAQVGPEKTTQAAYQTAGFGLHGVSFSRGEVPLVAGARYMLVWRVAAPIPPDSDGFNVAVSDDPYTAGDAWQSADGAAWQRHAGVTLCATVIEWRGDA